MITIFTPTYNREKFLISLYNSLENQSLKDFEWIVGDDGSTDNTYKLIENFKKKSSFIIRYFKQENSGKHIAINNALKIAKGEYFFIVDSDDVLPRKSIEIVNKWISTIKNEKDFVGVAGNKSNFKGVLVGNTFDGNFVDCTSLERKKYNINGDKAEVFKTDILKKYPFPSHPGEKFITESVIWNKIAKDGYKIRWFNETIYHCEYLEDGLSRTRGLFYNNFQGYIDSVEINWKCKNLGILFRLKNLTVCCIYAKKKKYSLKKLSKQLNINFYIIFILSLFGNCFYKLFGGNQ